MTTRSRTTRGLPSRWRDGLFAAAIAMACAWSSPAAAQQPVELVLPSSVDPGVAHFDEPNVVIRGPAPALGAALVVYLPGSSGRPQNVVALLQVIAAQGYRVIGLEYDDEPAVAQVCPRNPDPDCSAAYRQTRSFGDRDSSVSNPAAEAIVPRLAALLGDLARRHPEDGWNAYLDGAGQPAWDRIVLSGLSQGAGMAAWIAKQFAVRRVVLFSSPWDTTGSDDHPAPWLAGPSATPPDRWWAERHLRETTTERIARAYAALAIPEDHILLFDRSLPGNALRGPNPYHGSTVRDVGYAPQWQRLFGSDGS